MINLRIILFHAGNSNCVQGPHGNTNTGKYMRLPSAQMTVTLPLHISSVPWRIFFNQGAIWRVSNTLSVSINRLTGGVLVRPQFDIFCLIDHFRRMAVDCLGCISPPQSINVVSGSEAVRSSKQASRSMVMVRFASQYIIYPFDYSS